MPAMLAALVSGLVFGLGLTISQMINPAKVIGFLDLAGAWDPSLAFVIGGAVPVAAIGFAIAARRRAPLLSPAFKAPTQTALDMRLILGAVLFGIGWGLVGYCPGPALAALGLANPATVLFVAAMLVGMAGFTLLDALLARRAKPA